ncbi:MAG TPA: protein-disulfide reductase DsbD domain-containing protein [Planctomycetota bacterium]|nr:protein-disulfide reductase DsbD domain-containing protein [Planctomycetota bacterium]
MKRGGPASRLLLGLLLPLALLVTPAAAQQKGFGASQDPLTTHVTAPSAPAPAGGDFEVEVQLTIAPTWHLYAHDFVGEGTVTTLSLDATPGLTLKDVRYPAPTVVKVEPITKETLRLLEGTVELVAVLHVAPEHASGPAKALLRLTYQPCTDQECLFETERELPIGFEVVAAAAGPAPAAAKKGFGSVQDPLTASAVGPTEPVAAGSDLEVKVRLAVEAPWHLYAHDFTGTGTSVALSLDETPGLALKDVRYPPPSVVRYEPITQETLRLLEGSVELVAVLHVAPEHAPGSAKAVLRLEYQTCTDQKCLMPAELELPVAFEVRAAAAGEVTAPPATTSAPPAGSGGNLQDDFSRALKEGAVGRFLWLCIALAFVSLLTPCVFPMIPITVSFFAKRAEGGGSGAKYALAYGGGIVGTYTGFGVGMAALLGASSLQSLVTNPWVNLAIATLFVFFGLSLMGFYDLRPPAFLARTAEKGSAGGQSYLSVLVMGFVFTVTAFTCTAPIVGTLLVALTTGGSLPLIVLGMLVYSVAFALPFVLLALFPGALHALPGAGGWMITVKAVMGFVELVAALKFLSAADLVWNLQFLPRTSMLLLATLLMAALALYLFGAFRLPHDVPTPRRAVSGRTFVALLALLSALYFAGGLTGRTLDTWTESFLPPAGYGAGKDGTAHELIAWNEDLEAAKAAAAAQGRPLFIDFTGVTCNNCRKVEKSIFADRRCADALAAKAVPVRLYTDRRSPSDVKARDAGNRALMEQLGSVTLPLYVLMSADGRMLRSMGYDPSFTVQDFIDFLEMPR